MDNTYTCGHDGCPSKDLVQFQLSDDDSGELYPMDWFMPMRGIAQGTVKAHPDHARQCYDILYNDTYGLTGIRDTLISVSDHIYADDEHDSLERFAYKNVNKNNTKNKIYNKNRNEPKHEIIARNKKTKVIYQIAADVPKYKQWMNKCQKDPELPIAKMIMNNRNDYEYDINGMQANHDAFTNLLKNSENEKVRNFPTNTTKFGNIFFNIL